MLEGYGEVSDRAEVVAWVQVDADHLACPEWNLYTYHDVLVLFPKLPHVWDINATRLDRFMSGANHSFGYRCRALDDSGTSIPGSTSSIAKGMGPFERANGRFFQIVISVVSVHP